MNITKRLIKERLGFTTDVQIAEFFGVTKQAVGRWGGDDDVIPEGKQWQVRAMRPELFPDVAEQSAGQGEAA